MTRVLILGITGQDGSYLADQLVENGDEVHGMYRRSSTGNFRNIAHHLQDKPRIQLHPGELTDAACLYDLIKTVRPERIFNMADQDHVGYSLATPRYSGDVTYGGVINVLEAVRKLDKSIRVFQPCSSMMFGDATPPQNENTPFNPLSPYACAKVAAYYACRYYRQVHGMFVSVGIMFNHDSPRRTGDYLLHNIVAAAKRVMNRTENEIRVCSDYLKIDVGFSWDYMRAARSILSHEFPDDFVVGTGIGIIIKRLVRKAMDELGGYNISNPLVVDQSLLRPGPLVELIANHSKLTNATGWNPNYNAYSIISMLCDERPPQ